MKQTLLMIRDSIDLTIKILQDELMVIKSHLKPRDPIKRAHIQLVLIKIDSHLQILKEQLHALNEKEDGFRYLQKVKLAREEEEAQYEDLLETAISNAKEKT